MLSNFYFYHSLCSHIFRCTWFGHYHDGDVVVIFLGTMDIKVCPALLLNLQYHSKNLLYSKIIQTQYNRQYVYSVAMLTYWWHAKKVKKFHEQITLMSQLN